MCMGSLTSWKNKNKKTPQISGIFLNTVLGAKWVMTGILDYGETKKLKQKNAALKFNSLVHLM